MLAHHLQQRHHFLQGFGRAGRHDRKRTRFRTRHAAADRRVNQRNALFGQTFGNALHRSTANGGHFDIGPHTTHGADPISAQRDVFGNRCTWQAGQHHWALRRDFSHGCGRLRACFRHLAHSFRAWIIDQNLLARMALRPIGHALRNRATHGAQSQKADHPILHWPFLKLVQGS